MVKKVVKKKLKPLRLFVWENVLADHTAGIMFAIARTVEDARAVLVKKEPALLNFSAAEDLATEPSVYPLTKRIAFALWGGA